MTEYYTYAKKLIETGEFISVYSTLKDLEHNTIWFDTEHATSEVIKAYNERN